MASAYDKNRGSGGALSHAVASQAHRYQPFKTKLCRFDSMGRCRYGNNECPFAHGQEELEQLPDLSKTSLCRDWLNGTCKLPGSMCSFAHGDTELRMPPTWTKPARRVGIQNGQNGGSRQEAPKAQNTESTQGPLAPRESGQSHVNNQQGSKAWRRQRIGQPEQADSGLRTPEKKDTDGIWQAGGGTPGTSPNGLQMPAYSPGASSNPSMIAFGGAANIGVQPLALPYNARDQYATSAAPWMIPVASGSPIGIEGSWPAGFQMGSPMPDPQDLEQLLKSAMPEAYED
jgi:hypothetical protein